MLGRQAFLRAATGIVRWCVYVGLALPPLIVVASSFSRTTFLTFPPKGFTLAWYWRAAQSQPFMQSLLLSTELAIVATVLALLVGTPAAAAIVRRRFPGREAVQAALLAPMVVPLVVLAIGLLQVLTWLGLAQTFAGLVIAHVVLTLPYVVRTMAASLMLFDRSLEEAAMSLRARPSQVIRRVLLPILLPGVLSASVFCFVTSFGNITLSAFLARGGLVTLPVQIFTYVEHSYDPVLAAVSTLVIVVTLAVILLVERLAGLDRML
ncbi:MAG TPA: ABC transporter permease [Candidatus Methylomirabilis sp.]|nr:ABC transporter permease [Candidatus Methylomirabilis sp.]